MPVDPVANAQSPSIIAYNGDSPRGWNDPPTFAFSGNKGAGSRPKLDLRKRVSHHQALHGTKTPPNPPTTPTTSSYAGGGEVSDRMASLSLHSSSPMNPVNPPHTHHHNTTPPLHPKINHTPQTGTPSVPLYTPPPAHSYAHDRSHSLPSILMPSASVVPSGAPHLSSATSINTSTVPDVAKSPSPVPISNTPTHLGQPLFHLKDHSFEPVKTHNESGVRSTADLGDHLDDTANSNQHPQIFHPTPYPVANGLHTSVDSVPSIPTLTPSQGLISTHPTCPPAGHVSPISTTMVSQPGIPSTTPFQGGMSYGVSSHPPPSITPTLPVGHFTPAITNPSTPPLGHITPPPPVTASIPAFPAGHRTPTPTPLNPSTLVAPALGSLSTGSTPRCLSPEENGVDDGSSELSNEEGLKATMDALNDVIQKYHLKKRDSDDIAKRLKVMSKMWMEGKLGKTVKTKMTKLAKALDDGRGEDAHHIHITIIVDHVTELKKVASIDHFTVAIAQPQPRQHVNQWIVAVKRLISVVRHQPERTAPATS